VDAAVKLSALTAENDLGKAVFAGVAVSFAVFAGMDHAPADQLLLNQKENILRDDGFVVALHVVLRDGAIVLDALLRQEVRGIGLLKERITDVFFVAENLVDGAGVPFGFACTGKNAVSLKTGSNLIHAKALQVFPVDAPNDLSLCLIDDKVSVSVFSVAEEVIVVDLHFALLVAILNAELHVLRKALTFLLGKGRHNRKEYFAFGVHCVDGFLLEENRNVKVFELSDVFQAVQRVTGKAADRFGDNHINVSGMAFFNHAVKLVLC
jgi:hypothetical protein